MHWTPTQHGLQPTEILAFETTAFQFTYTDSGAKRPGNNFVETMVENVKLPCVATLVAAYPRIPDCWSGATRAACRLHAIAPPLKTPSAWPGSHGPGPCEFVRGARDTASESAGTNKN